MTGEISYLSRELVEVLHQKQIERFGGSFGLRDEGLLESALARPINRANFTESSQPELAAAYFYGLIKNHAFIDGNKRIAITAAGVFLMMNQLELIVDEAILYTFVMKAAEGTISEENAARFFADHCQPLSP